MENQSKEVKARKCRIKEKKRNGRSNVVKREKTERKENIQKETTPNMDHEGAFGPL